MPDNKEKALEAIGDKLCYVCTPRICSTRSLPPEQRIERCFVFKEITDYIFKSPELKAYYKSLEQEEKHGQ